MEQSFARNREGDDPVRLAKKLAKRFSVEAAMLFSKKSTAKLCSTATAVKHRFLKTCRPVFKFVILSEAKDLRFVARAETIAGKMSPRTES